MSEFINKQAAIFTSMALAAAGLAGGPAARAEFIPNLALGKATFATSAHTGWPASNLVDEDLRNSGSGTWHFTTPYPALPYYGGVDLAGAGNTVSVGTVRIFGLNGPNPTAWTLQSRDSAANPLDGLAVAGWTDTELAGGNNFWGLTHTFATPVDTRALRFNVVTANATNDRFGEIQVFEKDPHTFSRNAIDGLDPVLSREDGIIITSATSLDRLRDNKFDNVKPGDVASITFNLPDERARAVMNYDYTFEKAIYLDGARFYLQQGSVGLSSTVELQINVDGDWVTVTGGTSGSPVLGLVTFDFTSFASPIIADQVRFKHTAYDTQTTPQPRSGLYAYEIEIYGTPIPEPTSLALLGLAGLGLLRRRRR